MTGGTELAKSINVNLAKICGEYGLGMGLGSCRPLLQDQARLDDFMVKEYMPDQPLFANLGIAQIEEILQRNEIDKVNNMIKTLQADGLIIHVNPLQEWLQPEGDIIQQPPLDTIRLFLDQVDFPVIVKEVGQGFGKESLLALLKLRLEAIDFAALGGTNFSKLELFRSDDVMKETMAQVSLLGHDANTMVDWTNELYVPENRIVCTKLIISGGVKGFLDGYYYMQKSRIPAVYGMASGFLKYALEGLDEVRRYTEIQIKGLHMASSLLKVNVDAR